MPVGYDPRVLRLIEQNAAQLGLDPAAVAAVAAGEGGIRRGAVGDNGTSFGPFQLHWGGAMPKKYWGNAAASAAFANSPAGIRYAMERMAAAGAKGLQGADAVNAIVRRFERPADPNTSVARAVKRLGDYEPTGAVAERRQAPVKQAAARAFSASPPGQMQQWRQLVASTLMQRSAARAQGQQVPFGGLLGLAIQRQQMEAAQQVFGPPRQAKAAPTRSTASFKGNKLQLPSRWKGTHVTDGLDWNNGRATALDIMAPAGSPVGAPEAGEILEWDPEGAQGGGRVLFKPAKGKPYWIGHIDNALAPGTRVRKGQPFAEVSRDHPRPHVHIDRKL